MSESTQSAAMQNLLQKVAILATGNATNAAGMGWLESLVSADDNFATLIHNVNGYMANEAAVHGSANVIKGMALNGLGLQLSQPDANEFARQIQSGEKSWADLFVLCIELTDSLGQTLNNRADAAQSFLSSLQSTQKSSYFDGAAVFGAVKTVLQGVGASDASAVSAKGSLAALTSNLQASGIQGAVIDGYLSGATVFMDTNGDGALSAGEWSTKTDASGNYLLPSATMGSKLIASGGTDIMTGKPFLGVLTASVGATVITPLTTLAQALLESGQASSAQAAMSMVQKALGLSGSLNLLSYDPLSVLADPRASAADKAVALSVQKVSVQVVNLIAQVGAGIDAGSDATQLSAGQAVIAALANAMASGKAVNLANSATVLSITQAAVSNAGIAQDDPGVAALVRDIATISAASNTAAANSSNITQLAKSAVVAQSSAIIVINFGVLAGHLTNSVSSLTGAALDTKISLAKPGQLVPGLDVPTTPKPVDPAPVDPAPGNPPATPTFTVTESGSGPVIVGFANAGSTISVVVSGGKLVFTSGSTTKTTTAAAASIAEIQVGSGKTLSGAADALTGIKVAGAGNTMIAGTAGDQTLNIQTTGTNTIAGGKGADAITLGVGKDVVVVKAGETTAGTFSATVAFGSLSGAVAGNTLKVAIGSETFVSTYNGAAWAAFTTGSTATFGGVLSLPDAQGNVVVTYPTETFAIISASKSVGAATQPAGVAATTLGAAAAVTGAGFTATIDFGTLASPVDDNTLTVVVGGETYVSTYGTSAWSPFTGAASTYTLAFGTGDDAGKVTVTDAAATTAFTITKAEKVVGALVQPESAVITGTDPAAGIPNGFAYEIDFALSDLTVVATNDTLVIKIGDDVFTSTYSGTAWSTFAHSGTPVFTGTLSIPEAAGKVTVAAQTAFTIATADRAITGSSEGSNRVILVSADQVFKGFATTVDFTSLAGAVTDNKLTVVVGGESYVSTFGTDWSAFTKEGGSPTYTLAFGAGVDAAKVTVTNTEATATFSVTTATKVVGALVQPAFTDVGAGAIGTVAPVPGDGFAAEIEFGTLAEPVPGNTLVVAIDGSGTYTATYGTNEWGDFSGATGNSVVISGTKVTVTGASTFTITSATKSVGEATQPVDAGISGATNLNAEAQGVTHTASDSYWSTVVGGTWDTIANFGTGDTLDLDTAGLFNAGGASNGVVILNAEVLEAKLTALTALMETSYSVAAFVADGNTYIFQNNGVAGVQNSDIFIELTGVTLETLVGVIV